MGTKGFYAPGLGYPAEPRKHILAWQLKEGRNGDGTERPGARVRFDGPR